MNKKMKTEWVKALRSGDYKQGKEFLKSEQGYCCLGVLCDLNETHEVKKSGKGKYKMPTEGTLKKLGLYGIVADDWASARYPASTAVDYLAGMNDDGKSFKTIADAIESMDFTIKKGKKKLA